MLVGPFHDTTRMPSGLVSANTPRTVPSLPEVSMPCSTIKSLKRWSPKNTSCSWSISCASSATWALSSAFLPPEKGLAPGSTSASLKPLAALPVGTCSASSLCDLAPSPWPAFSALAAFGALLALWAGAFAAGSATLGGLGAAAICAVAVSWAARFTAALAAGARGALVAGASTAGVAALAGVALGMRSSFPGGTVCAVWMPSAAMHSAAGC